MLKAFTQIHSLGTGLRRGRSGWICAWRGRATDSGWFPCRRMGNAGEMPLRSVCSGSEGAQ